MVLPQVHIFSLVTFQRRCYFVFQLYKKIDSNKKIHLAMEIDVLEIFNLKFPFDKEPTGISEDIEYIVIVPHIYLPKPIAQQWNIEISCITL